MSTDDEIEELLDMDWKDVPSSLKRHIIAGAVQRRWWERTLVYLKARQGVIVVFFGLLGVLTTMADQIASFFQWIAETFGTKGDNQ